MFEMLSRESEQGEVLREYVFPDGPTVLDAMVEAWWTQTRDQYEEQAGDPSAQPAG